LAFARSENRFDVPPDNLFGTIRYAEEVSENVRSANLLVEQTAEDLRVASNGENYFLRGRSRRGHGTRDLCAAVFAGKRAPSMMLSKDFVREMDAIFDRTLRYMRSAVAEMAARVMRAEQEWLDELGAARPL
jgi:hypothetical protein